jgi:GNAT superfamily N-acetyltransferase
VIARARPEDLDELTALVAGFRDWWDRTEPGDEAIRATLPLLLDDPQAEFLLARDGQGRAVGFCQLRYRLSVWTGADDCWLEDLYVLDSAQGDGHGRALVEAAIESARARGCRRMELDVNEQNEALGFYRRLGFTAEPKPPGRTLFVSRKL